MNAVPPTRGNLNLLRDSIIALNTVNAARSALHTLSISERRVSAVGIAVSELILCRRDLSTLAVGLGVDAKPLYLAIDRLEQWIDGARVEPSDLANGIIDALIMVEAIGGALNAVDQPAQATVSPDPISAAVGLKATHPDWSDRKIAREAGTNPSKLSRNDTYQRVKKKFEERIPPKGTRDQEGNMEAVAD